MIEKTDILPQTFRKKNTALELRFTAAEDDFFVDVNMVRLKTGLVTRSHYILKSDLPTWISMFESEGWRRFSPQGTAISEANELTINEHDNLNSDISTTIQQ